MNKSIATLLLVPLTWATWAAMATAGDEGLVRDGALHGITLPAPATSLKEGAGMDTTTRYCGICHSLDYITIQPKFSLAKWQAEVAKMAKVYGAPIPEEVRPVIAQYIASQYGAGGAPSSPGPVRP